jgi:epoxyqueuosine reductase QueG
VPHQSSELKNEVNNMMKEIIENAIMETINASGLDYYRQPLVGYADARDPIFLELKTAVGSQHFLPTDLLPAAQTVFAFFLPFKKNILDNNRSGRMASREWAQVYIETNQLISRISLEIKKHCDTRNIGYESQPPTYVFDRKLLIANWSHRHVAYACGLGTFGRNNLLITRKGCGGRLGSGVLDIPLEASPRPGNIYGCYQQSQNCAYCIKICPVSALDAAHFDRESCYAQCLKNDDYYSDLDSCDVCGKCVTGPCGYLEDNGSNPT